MKNEDDLAWAVSLAVHVSILLLLSLLFIRPDVKDNSVIVIEVPLAAEEEILEAVPEEIVVSEDSSEAGSEGNKGLDLAGESLSPELTEDIQLSVLDLTFAEISAREEVAVPSAEFLDSKISTKGTGEGVSTKGAQGAVDILAAEIDANLEMRPTVVCWVFDQSVSLVAQRKEIADRLKKVFLQINKPGLRNIVVSYGEKVNFVVKSPTTNSDEVVEAIESIPVDESGIEMTFAAIQAAAEASRVFRTSSPKNNVMIVVFTDEVGNDGHLADKTSRYCRTMGVSVYVVGVPAPFGSSEVKIKYVEFDPKYQQEVTWAVVNQGPESMFPEFVRISGDDAVDSGFGPFNLSKICAETGGIYFRVHANSEAKGRVSSEETAPMASHLRMFFDPLTMRGYRPEYVSAEKMGNEIKLNRAKRALVAVASDSAVAPIDSPRMSFPRKDDAELASLLSEAQKASARVQPRIDKMCSVMAAGANDREKIKEKRWQAGFDLALGRLLATKVRSDAYNMMLAQAKSGMKFKNPESDTWELVPSKTLSVGSQIDKTAKQATELLEKVVSEHPGTPWAHYASEEMRVPLGYEWVERHTGVNKKMPAGGNNPPAPSKDDEKRIIAPPKPKRNLKNL